MYVQNKITNRFWNIKQHNYLLLNTVTSFTPSNSVSNLCCLQGESSQKCCWVCSCGLLKALHIIKCEEESDVRSSKFNSYPFTHPHTHKKKTKKLPFSSCCFFEKHQTISRCNTCLLKLFYFSSGCNEVQYGLAVETKEKATLKLDKFQNCAWCQATWPSG